MQSRQVQSARWRKNDLAKSEKLQIQVYVSVREPFFKDTDL